MALLRVMKTPIATAAVLAAIMATAAVAACNEDKPLHPFADGPAWINRLVVVDFVELGYGNPQFGWGMRFEGERYVGSVGLYTNWELAQGIVEDALMRPDRLKLIFSEHPAIWLRLTRAVRALAPIIAKVVEARRYVYYSET